MPKTRMMSLIKTIYVVKKNEKGCKGWYVQETTSSNIVPGEGPFSHGMPFPAEDLPVGSTHESNVKYPEGKLVK